ncbi:MAG: DUF4382 domain-containing protein [Gammaproteobacteria bacterium]|jgi:hypothetical protein
MKSFKSAFARVVLLAGFALFLTACGGGGSGDTTSVSSGGAPASGLTLRLTDAKVNSLEEVWITFTKVIFQPADGRDRFEHVFDPPIKVELTQLAGGGEVMLLEEYPLEPGDYEWMRLAVLSEEEHVDDTYVVEDGGGVFALKCPSCSADQSGLKLKWPKNSTWETEGWVDFTVDFDVRRSITLAKPNAGVDKKYILKPTLQILTTELASTYIHGEVTDAGLSDTTTREDCVVYVYQGADVDLDDNCSVFQAGDVCDAVRGDTALTTAPVDYINDPESSYYGKYAYRTGYLYPDTYTVALTCDDDPANTEDDLTFIGKTSFYADTVPEGYRHDFALADIVLTLNKTVESGDGPYEEGDIITYGYSVTNNSAAGADGVVGPVLVEDDKTEVTCESVSAVGNGDDNLDPGESVACSSTYEVTLEDALAGSVMNTATAIMGSTSSNTEQVTADTVTSPLLSLLKEGNLDDVFGDGETISYSLTASNDGNVALTNVQITDAMLAALDCTPTQPAVLGVGEILSCNGIYTLTVADVNNGSVSNIATASSDETGSVDSNEVIISSP